MAPNCSNVPCSGSLRTVVNVGAKTDPGCRVQSLAGSRGRPARVNTTTILPESEPTADCQRRTKSADDFEFLTRLFHRTRQQYSVSFDGRVRYPST